MNQRFDPSENRNVNPAAWPADKASQQTDPMATDPLANQRRPEDIEPRAKRSSWPILIILLAGLVLALLVWLPAELSNDQTNDAVTPSTTEQTTTPPADNATPPADNATPPVDNSATPGTATPETGTTPDSSTTTPNATPATPDTQTPATGTDTQTPATGTAPQN
ncbi:hypothetical protein OIU34_13535 [Pararhizobium sp. BT-229]|uniref:hypothetical protein n=1 Tax=Pararhizobium sp. BT-229 TaxID=2986923 RepID=UPI0021F7A70D|nr:hypothetical protein [Pararhizobium sp. BT-229]